MFQICSSWLDITELQLLHENNLENFQLSFIHGKTNYIVLKDIFK